MVVHSTWHPVPSVLRGVVLLQGDQTLTMTMRFELAYVWQSLDTPLTSFVARCGLAFHMRAKTAAGTEVQLTYMSRGGQFGRNHRTLVPAPF